MNTYREDRSGENKQYCVPSVLQEGKAIVHGQAPNSRLKSLSSSRSAVMMVDDDDVLVKLFKIFLEEQGIKVEVFTDPAEALRWYGVHYRQIRLVFLDIQMPKISGPECFENIIMTNPRVKVAYMSSLTDETRITELMKPRHLCKACQIQS